MSVALLRYAAIVSLLSCAPRSDAPPPQAPSPPSGGIGAASRPDAAPPAPPCTATISLSGEPGRAVPCVPASASGPEVEDNSDGTGSALALDEAATRCQTTLEHYYHRVLTRDIQSAGPGHLPGSKTPEETAARKKRLEDLATAETARCSEDKWSSEELACIERVVTDADRPKCDRDHLSEEQQRRLTTAIREGGR